MAVPAVDSPAHQIEQEAAMRARQLFYDIFGHNISVGTAVPRPTRTEGLEGVVLGPFQVEYHYAAADVDTFLVPHWTAQYLNSIDRALDTYTSHQRDEQALRDVARQLRVNTATIPALQKLASKEKMVCTDGGQTAWAQEIAEQIGQRRQLAEAAVNTTIETFLSGIETAHPEERAARLDTVKPYFDGHDGSLWVKLHHAGIAIREDLSDRYHDSTAISVVNPTETSRDPFDAIHRPVSYALAARQGVGLAIDAVRSMIKPALYGAAIGGAVLGIRSAGEIIEFSRLSAEQQQEFVTTALPSGEAMERGWLYAAGAALGFAALGVALNIFNEYNLRRKSSWRTDELQKALNVEKKMGQEDLRQEITSRVLGYLQQHEGQFVSSHDMVCSVFPTWSPYSSLVLFVDQSVLELASQYLIESKSSEPCHDSFLRQAQYRLVDTKKQAA